MLPEELACVQEAPPHYDLPEDERCHSLFTDRFSHVVGKHWNWTVAVWNPTWQVIEATEGEGVKSVCRSENHPTNV